MSPAAEPSKAFVAAEIRASHVVGRTFDAILRKARQHWGDTVSDDLVREHLVVLAEAGEIRVHPKFPDRYLHRNHFPPRAVADIELPLPLTSFAARLAEIGIAARVHGELTTDHLDFVTDDTGRRAVVFDRPVHPRQAGATIPFPRI